MNFPAGSIQSRRPCRAMSQGSSCDVGRSTRSACPFLSCLLLLLIIGPLHAAPAGASGDLPEASLLLPRRRQAHCPGRGLRPPVVFDMAKRQGLLLAEIPRRPRRPSYQLCPAGCRIIRLQNETLTTKPCLSVSSGPPPPHASSSTCLFLDLLLLLPGMSFIAAGLLAICPMISICPPADPLLTS